MVLERVTDQIDTGVRERLKESVVSALYEGYVEYGMMPELVEIISKLPELYHPPLIHTLSSHVTKEKPIFVFSIGMSLLPGSENVIRTSAAATDFLWALSLIHDDAFDRDKLRAGKESVWVKYGEDVAQDTVSQGLVQLGTVLDEKIDKQASHVMWHYVNLGIESLETHKQIPLGADQKLIEDNYTERAHFHTTLPLTIVPGLSDQENFEAALNALKSVNFAGQMLNDLKDMSFDYSWIRQGFSDIKSGMVTVPISIMYSRADERQKSYLESIFGKKKLNDDQVVRIVEILDNTQTVNMVRDLANKEYEQSLMTFGQVLAPEYKRWPKIWIEYKQSQLQNL